MPKNKMPRRYPKQVNVKTTEEIHVKKKTVCMMSKRNKKLMAEELREAVEAIVNRWHNGYTKLPKGAA